MRVMIVVLVMLLAQGPKKTGSPGGTPRTTDEQGLSTALLRTYDAIVEKGTAIWEKLGKGQAVSVLQKVATEAANLEILKTEDRNKVADNKMSWNQLEQETHRWKEQVLQMKWDLEKFAREIDAAAHPVGEDLRIAAENAVASKAAGWDKALADWHEKGRDAAVEDLDSAIKDLQKIRKAVGCLQDSITDKKAACDKDLTRLSK